MCFANFEFQNILNLAVVNLTKDLFYSYILIWVKDLMCFCNISQMQLSS